MRQIVRPRRAIKENADSSRKVFRATLAEDYDGIGQHILIALSGSSSTLAYRARIASGDFGTGQTIPAGTTVSVFSNRGQLEILSMGAK